MKGPHGFEPGLVPTICVRCGELRSNPVHGFADHGLVRHTDPDTSHAAAHAIDPRGQQRAALRGIVELGTATMSELARHGPLTEHQLSRRLSELAEAGLIVDTGTRRPGVSGRAQRVWRPA